MGVNDKLAATFHPDGKSGAQALLDATGVIDRQVEHAANLQAAVDEIKELANHWVSGARTTGHPAVRQAGSRVLSVLNEHHV